MYRPAPGKNNESMNKNSNDAPAAAKGANARADRRGDHPASVPRLPVTQVYPGRPAYRAGASEAQSPRDLRRSSADSSTRGLSRSAHAVVPTRSSTPSIRGSVKAISRTVYVAVEGPENPLAIRPALQ